MSGAHPADPPSRASDADRSPDELREELVELRAELGDTVEELAHRVDVPARVRAKRDETATRVRAKLDETTVWLQKQFAQARAVLAETATGVEATLRDRPGLVGGITLVASYLLVSGLRRRKRRRRTAALGGKDGDGTR
jgi:transposase-like protein